MAGTVRTRCDETDHEKLVELADKINQILEHREKKLREQRNPQS